MAVVLLADALTGFHFLGRVIDQKETFPLSGITTGERVTITYDGEERIIDDLAEGESRTVTLDGTDWTFVRQGDVYYYQNGYGRLVSLLSLLVFAFFFCRHMAAGINSAGQMTTGGKQEKELQLKLQLAATALVTAYLVGLLCNDSTLFTTPLVCIMVGMALAASYMCQK